MSLFEKQRKIYARRVWGKYRKLKWLSMVTLLGIYYGVPWLRWDRGPNAPDQAILIDMPARRGYFFGIEIWPQEVYLLVGILILAAVGLFFATSLLGRVWCGYACPQTVWTDLFVWVERIVQGDRNARMKLDQSPWSLEKIRKKFLTHSIWILIGACTGGAWVFYFNDAPTLADQILHLDVPWSVGGWIAALTFSTYVMAGFAREQVCTYMCPYARFQSAMFDRDTLIITYDADRGEPRGKHKAGDTWEGRGACIDCDSCVVVCPVGIDIRNGLQYQCISCGLCVDACNNVMDKIGLPRGLIRYDTENNQNARKATPGWRDRLRWVRPRTVYYALIMAFVGSLMLYAIITRSPLELNVIHNRNPLFVTLSDGSIRNSYTLKILNKTHDDKHFALTVRGLDNAKITLQGAGAQDSERIEVLADSVGQLRLLVDAPKTDTDRQPIAFVIKDNQTGTEATHESYFIQH
jgi:cytochrome c oxidase accessory protein FixG